MKEISSLDTFKYLKHLRLEVLGNDLKPSYENLTKIIQAHLERIPYQNYSSLYKKTPDQALSLEIKDLQERLIDNNTGGMCYEISELLRYLLVSLGYEVSIFRTWVLNNRPFNENHPPSHNILCVEILDKLYLVDVAFGYNSLRAPALFDPASKCHEFTLGKNEKYLLSSYHDQESRCFYELSMKIQNSWFSFYRFYNQSINYQDVRSDYLNLLKYQDIPIVSTFIKCAKITPIKRICFSYDGKKFSYLEFRDGEKFLELDYNSLNDFSESLYEQIGVTINDSKYMNHEIYFKNSAIYYDGSDLTGEVKDNN